MNPVTIRSDSLALTLLPGFGCHWLSLRSRGDGRMLDLIEPVSSPACVRAEAFKAGAYLLAPWSNRQVDARFRFRGRLFELTPNYPDGSAIHGDVFTRAWHVERADLSSFEGSLDSADFPDFNFPFRTFYRFAVTVSGGVLSSSLQVQNRSGTTIPVGLGFHPFWARRLRAGASAAIVRFDASAWVPTENGVPVGPPVGVPAEKSLAVGRSLDGLELDDCYANQAATPLEIRYEEPALTITIQPDPAFRYAVVYAPANLDGAPCRFAAVEPVTHVTDGFNLLEGGRGDTGVRLLDPDETFEARWRIRVTR